MTEPSYRKELPIDLDAITQSLERPLALIDNPERRADMQRFLDAANVHLERAILDLLAAALDAVNEAAPGVNARVQFAGGAPAIVVETSGAAAPAQEEPAPGEERLFETDGDMEKVTIRLPAELKDLIAQAASLRGTSVNSWYVRELARTVSRATRDYVREESRHGRWHPPRDPEPPFSRPDSRPPRERNSLRGFVGDD